MGKSIKETNATNKSYCKFQMVRTYKKKQILWEKDLHAFLDKENWDYNFEYENTVGHCEQSFLSQMIFGHLFKIQGYHKFLMNRYYMYVIGDDKKLFFHYDVMNNPNTIHELGRKVSNQESENKRKEWKKIYHTIGNFTPIPWPKKVNLQLKHKNFGERWDRLLEFLQNNWNDWDKSGMTDTFEAYMKITFQQLYFADVFEKFKEQHNSDLKYISKEEWKVIIVAWNEEIDNSKCLDIVSFNGNIAEVMDNIMFLIEARGRCIMTMLKPEE